MPQAPSMTGLRALEAVLRHGTLSAAARELCVTPAAISHRLRELEARCGVPLVHRSRGRFEATERGRKVAEALGDAFQRIRLADDLLTGPASREFRIAASYSFAVMWLMPRIAMLEQQFPDVDLIINPTHAPLSDGPSDVTILHAAQPPAASGWTRLFVDRCAAMARAQHPFFTTGPRGLQEVLDCRLIHIAHDRGPAWGEFSWQDWAAGLGIAWPDLRKRGPSVSAEHVAADMLLTSDSFALISVVNASELLDLRLLRAVPGSTVDSACSYWISGSGASGSRVATARRFVDWMTDRLGA